MKKLFRSTFILFIILGSLVGSVSAKLTSIGVKPNELYIEVGQEYQLEAYYTADDGSTCEPRFTKSNYNEDGYDITPDGLVTGLKIGDYEAEVDFIEPGQSSFYYRTVAIHVLPKVESIKTSKDEYTFYYHKWELGNDSKSFDLDVQIEPSSYKPEFNIKDEKVVSLDYNNKLVPEGFGTTDVTVQAGSKSKTVRVSIVDKEKTGYDKFSDSPTQDIIFPNATDEIVPTVTNNINSQDYSVWSKPIKSYLVKSPEGYMRVEYNGEKVIITYINNEFKPVNERTIDCELPSFGGFYNGKDNFFLVFGDANGDESDAKEVVRVVKYDKSWNRIAHSSLNGANTYIPFDAGSLRMAEYKDKLYVRTSHEMYASSDGLHHQANLTIEINVPNMEIDSSNYEVSNSGTGYVSHSFNQFIMIDKGDIIALDHGDAYPRTALLGMYSQKAGEKGELSSYGYVSQHTLDFAGETGNNNTNASIGGLSASDANYLTVGNSSDQSSINSTNRNIYVSVTPKDNLTSDNTTQIKWLTNYADGTKPSTPHLVKFDDNNFLVLWSTSPTAISYVFVDGNGNPKGEIKSVDGAISDCLPIVNDSKATWYVTDGKAFTLYSIDSNGNLEKQEVVQPAVDIYRLYNASNNEHLYTSDANEATTLVAAGWRDEGIGWQSPASGEPVYRLYSPVTNNHLFTTDLNEKNVLSSQGWQVDNGDQPLFYSGGSVPIYRLYNESIRQHLLTKDDNEYNVLPGQGWNPEGAKLYCLS